MADSAVGCDEQYLPELDGTRWRVSVFQIYINGDKPTSIPGADDSKVFIRTKDSTLIVGSAPTAPHGAFTERTDYFGESFNGTVLGIRISGPLVNGITCLTKLSCSIFFDGEVSVIDREFSPCSS